MKIGFYHSCFLEWDIDKTFAWGKEHGFSGIELHGGPRCKHLNWAEVAEGRASSAVLRAQDKYGLPIIGIMYGALPFLSPDPSRRQEAQQYIEMLFKAAANLGVKVVSAFTGRDPLLTLEQNLERFGQVFPRIADMAENYGVVLAFENCPMYEFWPPAYNIAVSPFMWKEMFDRVPSHSLGLNIDPSHLVWQGIDIVKSVRDFKDRIVLAQAKDTEVLPDILREEGMLTLRWWRHRIPGQGDIDWKRFMTALHEIGYDGVVSIEHEDPIWSGTDEKTARGLLLAKTHLEQFL